MASKRKRILLDKHTVQELILDSDYDAHTSEGKILPHESDSEKEARDRLHTVDWQYTFLTFSSSHSQFYKGSQWDKKKLSTHYEQRFRSS
jgi:hypothetical protein